MRNEEHKVKGVFTIEYTSEEMSNAEGGLVKQKLSWELALLTNVKHQLDNKHRLVNSLRLAVPIQSQNLTEAIPTDVPLWTVNGMLQSQ